MGRLHAVHGRIQTFVKEGLKDDENMTTINVIVRSSLHNTGMVMLSDVKEGSVLFNDALNTFFIYGYMASDHSDSERGNPLPPHGLLFSINSKGYFTCTIPQTG